MITSPRQLPPAVAEFPAAYARTARFTLGTPRNITVTTGGDRVLFCRPRSGDDAALCLWALDVDQGTERLVVDPADLASAGDELPPAERARRERARDSASGIVAFSTDRAGSAACFAVGGQLFVVNLASGAVSAPGHSGAVYDPRLSPHGTAIAYVDAQDLRVIEIDAGAPGSDRVLRSSTDPLVSFGRAEFIAAEEMGRSRGFWWAPDGGHLLVTRVDESPVTEWWITDPAQPDRRPTAIRFPPAGTANAAVGLELVGVDGQWCDIDWSDGGRFEYLADVVWPAARPPLIVRQTRDQKVVSVAELSLDDLTVSERHAIVDDTWVDLIPGSPAWCSAGLLTIEDGAEARHLCLDGSPITGNELNIRSIIGLVGDGDGGDGDGKDGGEGSGRADRAVIVSAWTVPTEIHLIAVPLPSASARSSPSPAGASRLLTGQPGVHGASVEGTTLVVTASRPDAPGSRATVHRLDPATITEPASAQPPSARSAPGLPVAVASIADHSAAPGLAADPVFLTLGPDQLHAALFWPSGHDGRTRLPVLLDPYGGPHAQRVLKSHNGHLVSRWFAEHGYAVLVVDGRGTPGRGPGWERAVWGDLAGPVLDDQLAALDGALERFEALDGSRVGIRGWSFGGYLAALAVLRRPDRFHAAVAGAPVTAWGLYDTHYTERYLGHPSTHPAHYQRSDLLAEIDLSSTEPLLERPMLLIHGLADDNVVAAHTLQLSSALLANGSPHRVLPLSGVTHMASQHAVAENLLRLQLAFLDETIGLPRP